MSSVRGWHYLQTLPGLVRKAAQECPERPFIRWIRPICPEADPELIRFGELEERVRRATAFFREKGLKSGDRILFLAENSPHWQVLALAAQALRAEVVSLFASLGTLDVVDIVCRILPKLVVVSNGIQWSKLESVLASLGARQKIITLEPDLEIPKKFESDSIDAILRFPPLSNQAFEKLLKDIGPEDPFVMIFTSGTTGRQKGVRIPQRAIASAIEGGLECTASTSDDLGLHILPFGHIAGLGAFYAALKGQSGLILCSRREDLLKGFSLGPTYVFLVPLLYERIWKEVLRKIHKKPKPISALLRALLSRVVRAENGKTPGLWNRLLLGTLRFLIGRPLRHQLGGRIRFLAAGGALSDPEMVEFYRALGFHYLNLYGMSETCGVISLSWLNDPGFRPDSVGHAWKEVEVKISEDEEILVRGETLMTGYLEREANRNAYTEEGYFRTGDLGRMDAEGYLYITGRKKNTFVLSTGKKLSPEGIEVKLREVLPMITDAVLVGDGEAFISAALFLPKGVLQDLRARRSEAGVKAYFLEKIRRGFSQWADYETPKQVFLIEGAPYDYPKLITPTLKIKRNVFGKLFAPQIAQIYRHGEIPQPKVAAM